MDWFGKPWHWKKNSGALAKPSSTACLAVDGTGKQVLLGDGAAWIWKMAEEMFPQAIQVLDVFHALEKIGDVVADNFKDKKERAHEFRLLKVWLKRGKLDAVLKRLSNMQNAKTTIRYCRTYWEAKPSFSDACIRDW